MTRFEKRLLAKAYAISALRRGLFLTLEGHAFATTQVQLPEYLANAIKGLQDLIPEEDLDEQGKETDYHITVKYGLHTNLFTDVEEALYDEEDPIEYTFGEVGLFTKHPDYDVVIVRVSSECLERIHKKLSERLEHTSTHPVYLPHATVAYVKKGRGDKFDGRQDLTGQSGTAYGITFCSKGDERQQIITAVPTVLGGAGSGNFGHAGRPGERGGSVGGGGWPEGLEKIGEAKGSNSGGLYVDAKGQKWYVKNYKDPLQAAGEQVANNLYRAVGIRAPHSVLGKKGKYASKWEDDAGKTLGKTGLTEGNTDAILDGFVADVFLSNWDAVGTGHDNVLVSGNRVTRIDQGGTLLHRAQGALKPEAALTKIGEWESLADPSKNAYYAKVFKKAGVKDGDALGQRAIDQIDRIAAARPEGGWKAFVKKHAPEAGEEYADKVGGILEKRQSLLLQKKRDLEKNLQVVKALGGVGSGNFGHAGRPGEVGGSADDGAGTTESSKATEGIAITKKQKHTKDQIAEAMAMKEQGFSSAAIQKKTGLHPSTQYHHFTKVLKAKEKIAEALKTTPAPDQKDPETEAALAELKKQVEEGGPSKATKEDLLKSEYEAAVNTALKTISDENELNDHLNKLNNEYLDAKEKLKQPTPSEQSAKQADEAAAKKAKEDAELDKQNQPAQAPKAYWKKNPATGKYEKVFSKKAKAQMETKDKWDPVKAKQIQDKANAEAEAFQKNANKDVSLLSPTEAAEAAVQNGYKWKEKTTGPNKGKYAWFDEDVQVSAPFDKADAGNAANSMHYGKGPKAPASNKFEPSETPEGWPVKNDVLRVTGQKYERTMNESGNNWKANLTVAERDAIHSYTGNGYVTMNKSLWDGSPVKPGTKSYELQKALAKAPTPPPPELVWRGLKSGGANAVQGLSPGDELQLNGFQSTSIRPLFAKNWGGQVLLEIKPKKGGYVAPMSSHSGEKEYLLPHGAKYRVRGTTQVKVADKVGDAPKTVKVIQLEML